MPGDKKMSCLQCIDAMPNKASIFQFVCLQTNFNIKQRARKKRTKKNLLYL